MYVIYMIKCRLCNLHCIGETKRRLKDRFNEHRRPILNPTSSYIHTAVSEHFLRNNHFDNKQKNISFNSRKQSGAVEACWAHNPEVRGSKPRSAIFSSLHPRFAMNDLPVIRYLCYAQRFLGSPGGQTLQVARKKCMA